MRLSKRKNLLAEPLGAYAAERGYTDSALAAAAGCSLAQLTRLKRYRTPRNLKEVATIADSTGCDPDRLVDLMTELNIIEPEAGLLPRAKALAWLQESIRAGTIARQNDGTLLYTYKVKFWRSKAHRRLTEGEYWEHTYKIRVLGGTIVNIDSSNPHRIKVQFTVPTAILARI